MDSCAPGSPEVQVGGGGMRGAFYLSHTSQAGLVPRSDSCPESSCVSLGFLMAFPTILEPYLCNRHTQAQGLGLLWGLVPSKPCV